MNQSQIGSFESIPLSSIRPSTTNPRKHFDQAKLDELTASVRALGVTVPIHVRSLFIDKDAPLGERLSYELVTGERRFRAATAASLTELPAFVHDGMSDEDAMDLQMVENLQREDLHPVEEAEGYRALMAHGETAEDVAKKAGKTLGYVQQRLKLLTLEVDAKQLFLDKHLTLDHALLLARLTPRDQERALLYLLGIRDWELDSKLDKEERASKAIARSLKDFTGKSSFGGDRRGRLVNPTHAELREWITSNVLLVLKGVPWDLGDAELLPEVGACTTCANRTGVNAALFADLTTVDDTCVSPGCFADKQKAFTRRQQELAKEQGSPLLKISAKSSTEKLEKPVVEIRPSAVKMQGGKPVETKRAVVVATKPVKAGQWIAAKKGSCPSTVQAIAVDGPDQGKLRFVCADQSCKVHPRQVSRPAAERVDRNMNSEANRAKREAEEKVQEKVNQAIAAEILDADAKEAISKLIVFFVENTEWPGDVPDLCLMLDLAVPGYRAEDSKNWQKQNIAREKAKPIFRKYIEEATLPELQEAARAVLVLFGQESYDDRDMLIIAKMFDVDPKSIDKAVRAKLAAEAKAASGTKVATLAKASPAAKKTPAKKASSGGTKTAGIPKGSPTAKAIHDVHTNQVDKLAAAAEQAGA